MILRDCEVPDVDSEKFQMEAAVQRHGALLHGCPGGGLVVLPALQIQRICRMPNKHNAKRRHHIAKMKYSVRNWREYDAALRARGSLTMWVTPEAMAVWTAQPRSTPGGQSFYSDLAIETSLMLRLVFRQALRQTEGLMASIFELLEVDLKAPDHSTVSRRAMSLPSISKRCALPAGAAHILADSTRVKVYGAGEWLQEKHGQKSRRSWRKLHLAVDADTGYIVASILTEQDVDDPSQVGPLLDQIEHEIGQVMADGAYDGEPTYETIAQRDPQIEVVIPPRVTAQPSAQFETDPTMRDTHLLMIQSLGRLDWQEACGYGHSVRWWRPRWAATRRSSVRDCVRVTGGASVLKRPSRWTSSTACWVLDARIPSAIQRWRHKPHWGWGNLVFSVIRATTPASSSPPLCWQITFGLTTACTGYPVATLSPELHTKSLPASHVWVGNG